jgi:hypothetical protein
MLGMLCHTDTNKPTYLLRFFSGRFGAGGFGAGGLGVRFLPVHVFVEEFHTNPVGQFVFTIPL